MWGFTGRRMGGPVDVGVNDLNELLNGCRLPVPRVEQLRLQPPEETLTDRIVRPTVPSSITSMQSLLLLAAQLDDLLDTGPTHTCVSVVLAEAPSGHSRVI